jgi:1-acyl-sn-glycerol-3-phosphate acyltransferase
MHDADAPLEPSNEVHATLLQLMEASLGHPVLARPADRFTDLGFDELARAHLNHYLEQRFHIVVDPGHGPRPETVADLLGLIEKKTYWTYPAPPQGTALDLARGGFAKRFLRPPAQGLFRLFLRLAFRYRAQGRTHVPRHGPFVLVANHSGHPDAPALMAAIPLGRVNEVHPLAAQDYFFKRRAVGMSVHFLVNALPIDRDSNAERALKAALDLLAEGHGIILFPEGTRSTTGEIAPFKKGVGLLVCAKPYPAIPAYIQGSRDVLPKGAKWPRRATLRVTLGAPRTYAGLPDDRDGWKAAAADLENAVKGLQAAG